MWILMVVWLWIFWQILSIYSILSGIKSFLCQSYIVFCFFYNASSLWQLITLTFSTIFSKSKMYIIMAIWWYFLETFTISFVFWEKMSINGTKATLHSVFVVHVYSLLWGTTCIHSRLCLKSKMWVIMTVWWWYFWQTFTIFCFLRNKWVCKVPKWLCILFIFMHSYSLLSRITFKFSTPSSKSEMLHTYGSFTELLSTNFHK